MLQARAVEDDRKRWVAQKRRSAVATDANILHQAQVRHSSLALMFAIHMGYTCSRKRGRLACPIVSLSVTNGKIERCKTFGFWLVFLTFCQVGSWRESSGPHRLVQSIYNQPTLVNLSTNRLNYTPTPNRNGWASSNVADNNFYR